MITTEDVKNAVECIRNNQLPENIVFDMNRFASMHDDGLYHACLLGIAGFLKFQDDIETWIENVNNLEYKCYVEEDDDIYKNVYDLFHRYYITEKVLLLEWDQTIAPLLGDHNEI